MIGITQIKIASLAPKAQGLVATAVTGSYMTAPNHPSAIIVQDPAPVPNKQLNLGEHYAIAATDPVTGKAIPVHSNYFLDAINPVAGSLLYVFLQ